MAEPERRTFFIVQNAPKGTVDWKSEYVCDDRDSASTRLAAFSKSRHSWFWDFRIVQVDEIRTVVE